MKCCNLLRKYVLGDTEVGVQYLSDPERDYEHCDRREVNYMDPNLVRISLMKSFIRKVERQTSLLM